MGAMKIIDPNAWNYAEDAPYAWRVIKSVQIDDPETFRFREGLGGLIASAADVLDPSGIVQRSAIRDVVIVKAPDGQASRALLYADAWPRVGVGWSLYRMLLSASGVVLLDRAHQAFALQCLEEELAEHCCDESCRNPRTVTDDLSIMSLVQMIDEVSAGAAAAWSTKSRLWHASFMTVAFTPRRARWDEALALMRLLTMPSSHAAQEVIGLRVLGIGEG